MEKVLSTEEMLEVLREGVRRAGSQKAYAQQIGMPMSNLSSIMLGRDNITERLANALGYTRIFAFVPIDTGE